MQEIKNYHVPEEMNTLASEPVVEFRKPSKEEAIARFMAAKAKKKMIIAELEQEMKEEYGKRTGLKANYFFAL